MQKDMIWKDQKAHATIFADNSEYEKLLTAMIEARGLGLKIEFIRKHDAYGSADVGFFKTCSVEEFAKIYQQAAELGWC